MVVIPQGDIFNSGPAVSGSKSRGTKTWKYCPYSTQITNYNGDIRVTGGEKIHHGETEGRLHVYSLGGVIGFVCADNDCTYFAGTATTEVTQQGRKFVPTQSGCPQTEDQLATLSGSVQHLTAGRTIVSGTRYYEI